MQFLNNSLGVIFDFLVHLSAKVSNYIVTNRPPEWEYGKRGDVILIQGFGGTWSYLTKIGNLANKMGYKVHTLPKLKNNIAPVHKCSQILEEYLHENSITKAVVVAHSKGGVIAKYFLVNSKLANRITKVVSLSSPFKGTLLGYLDIFNSKELTPGSKLLQDLEKATTINKMFVNLYPRVDNLVIPNKNLVLKNAQNIKIDMVGHLRILISDKALKHVEEALND